MRLAPSPIRTFDQRSSRIRNSLDHPQHNLAIVVLSGGHESAYLTGQSSPLCEHFLSLIDGDASDSLANSFAINRAALKHQCGRIVTQSAREIGGNQRCAGKPQRITTAAERNYKDGWQSTAIVFVLYDDRRSAPLLFFSAVRWQFDPINIADLH